MQTIWAKNRKDIKNDELSFVVKIKKPNENAKMVLVGRDVYNVYINGEFITYGPARAGHGYVRSENLDLTKFLTDEENILVVNLINNNTIGLSLVSEYPLFGAEIYFDNELTYCSADFTCYEMTDRIKKVERFTSMRGFNEYYKTDFDRKLFFKGKLDLFPKLETETVETPTILNRGVNPFKYEIVNSKKLCDFYVKEVKNPTWHNDFTVLLDDGVLLDTYKRSECDRVISDRLNNFEVCDKKESKLNGFRFKFDRVYTGKIIFNIDVKKDSIIYLLFDEVLTFGRIKFNRDETIHAHAWELKAGKYTLETFEVYGYRYIDFIVDGDAIIDKVSSLTVENPDTGRFKFGCEDKDIETIVDSAKHVIEQNATDILTDCPSRERAGWLCDSYFSSRAERLFTGYNLVEANHLQNYCLFKGMNRLRSDVLPECYPSETEKGNFIPNWLAWFVLELSSFVDRTGDIKILDKFKQKVETLLNFFSQYENELGLLEDLPGWVFVEWSDANKYVNGINFPTNMLYTAMLETVGALYNDNLLIEKSKLLKAKIEKLSYNGEFYVDNATRENGKLVIGTHCSEIGQYYAIFFNITDKDKKPDFVNKMITKFGMKRDENKVYPDICKANMFIGNYLRLEILLRYKEYNRIIDECKDFLLVMAKENNSLWENRVLSPKLDYKIPGSCCHGFASVSATYIVEALTGYQGFSELKKEIYLSKKHLNIDTKINIPILDKVFNIECKKGNIFYNQIEGYEIVIK